MRGPRRDTAALAGGYYAARLAALEHLALLGRQAAVLAVREISEAYWAPLGVWVVREVARKAMTSPPLRLGSLPEAMAEMERRIKTPVGTVAQDGRAPGEAGTEELDGVLAGLQVPGSLNNQCLINVDHEDQLSSRTVMCIIFNKIQS